MERRRGNKLIYLLTGVSEKEAKAVVKYPVSAVYKEGNAIHETQAISFTIRYREDSDILPLPSEIRYNDIKYQIVKKQIVIENRYITYFCNV